MPKSQQQRYVLSGFRRILATCLFFLSLLMSLPSLATPEIGEIEEEIKQFQKFFLDRFPTVQLQAYQNGVNALPQYAHRLRNWELHVSTPNHLDEIERMQQRWQQPFIDGATFTQCFSDKPAGNQYPYFNGTSIRTIVSDINDCLSLHGERTIDPNHPEMAKLVAFYKSRANGQPMSVDYSSPEMREAYQKGRQYYWTRRGQLNFSCASCHVQNAGNQLRSDVIGAAMGQTTGFPVYRTTWAFQGQPWGTVHRRYASCNVMAGAAPLPPQSEEYVALQVYQAIMNTGIPLNVPGRRQ
ncbi:MAG: sulfur oxidation c-type cytochrome SoxA [Gammaproteobacteria bacterium]|nr:sulfur oxidation c-type cytochrome SoxA [Gammaproteobacteria bacterium]